MGLHRWIEIAALGSLAGIFAFTPIHDPQAVDAFAVPFFLFGSLLIDAHDIEASDWTGHRPFVFGCAALILAIPFVAGACSANSFNAQVGSGVYIAAAPPALFLVASKARFRLVGPRSMRRLILAGIFAGLIPATVYALLTTGAPPKRFSLPGQPAFNIAAAYLSCITAITLNLTVDLGRRVRVLGYVTILALLALGLLTASRTFLVSMVIVFGAYWLTIRRDKALWRAASVVMGAVVAIAAASFFVFRSGLTRLFTSSSDFFDGRLQSWADGWEIFRRYPLCGIGPNTFYDTQLNPLYRELSLRGTKFHAYYHAHNIFLNTLAEGGLVVFLLLLVLIAAATYGCYVILKDNSANPFGLIAIALLAIFLVVGLFENTIVRPVIFPLALMLGLGMNVTWRRALPPRKPG